MNGFALIADPTRRRILDVLRTQGTDVGGLVEVLRLPQPLVSKHLRVLRDAGTVTATIAGKRRVYRLTADPLPDVLAWMLPYQQLWAASLGQLSRALDEQARDAQARDDQARDDQARDDQARDLRADDEEATP
ncbi:MAG TPA: metalloregulator ArsR/SmtB family transcription factor [Streptosporangiaceae bacterium]